MAGASLRTLTASSAYADEAAANIMRPSASSARHLIKRNVSSPRSTATHSVVGDHCHECEGNQRVSSPPLLVGLKRQHNFANMFGGLHAPVRFGGLFQRK